MTTIVYASDVKTKEKHYVVRFSNGTLTSTLILFSLFSRFSKILIHTSQEKTRRPIITFHDAN